LRDRDLQSAVEGRCREAGREMLVGFNAMAMAKLRQRLKSHT